MKFKRYLSLLLCLIILGSSAAIPSSAEETVDDARYVFNPSSGFPAINLFSVKGSSALLCALDTDMILYAQDIDTTVYPASLAKIMTCLVAYEAMLQKGDTLDVEITVSYDAVKDRSLEYETGEILIGEVLTLKELLLLIMLPSVNEACNVVAEYSYGSIPNFVAMMNQRARELGCTGTNFTNPTGLHDYQEVTTARDLMKMTKMALSYDDLAEIMYTKQYEMRETNCHESRWIYTTNYLVSKNVGRYYYANAKGIKSGYTSQSGRSLITVGDNGDIRLLVIVTGCKTSFLTGSEYMLHNFSEGKNMLVYGFTNFEYLTVLNSENPCGSLPVTNGKESDAIVVPMKNAGVALPTGYTIADIEVTLDGKVTAPAAAGDVVGTATVYYRKNAIATVNVTPLHDIAGYTEEELAEMELETQRELKNASRHNLLLILLIVILVLLVVYLGGYIYLNMNRKNKKRKTKSTAKKKTAGKAKVRYQKSEKDYDSYR